jgi:hypothetical protein
MLEREIEKIAASTPGSRSPAAPDGQLVQIRTAMDVAAGEVIDDGKVLLVYAVLSRQELLRRICGTSLDRRLASRHMARVMRKRA